MRLIALVVFLPTYASAWEFSLTPLCTLTHQSEHARIEITHDPAIPEYRMTLDLFTEPWARSETFGMTFRGGRSLTIGTNRHIIDKSRLSVSDTGFGNVLNGLEYNALAIAFTSSQSIQFSLAEAAPEVRKFRSCAKAGPAIS